MRNYALFLALAVFAFAGTGYAHHNKACKQDIKQHCKGIDVKDKDAILACLAQHESVLSKKCQKSHAKELKALGEAAAGGAPTAPATAPAPETAPAK